MSYRTTSEKPQAVSGPATRYERMNARFMASRFGEFMQNKYHRGDVLLVAIGLTFAFVTMPSCIYMLESEDTGMYLIECPGEPSWKSVHRSADRDAFANADGHMVYIGSACTVTVLGEK